MNLWTLPALDFGTLTPSSINLANPDQVTSQQKDAKIEEKEFQFHRLPVSTELRDSGAADQLTRLSDILKDAPKKKGLSFKPAHHIPPLAVLNGKAFSKRLSFKPIHHIPFLRDFPFNPYVTYHLRQSTMVNDFCSSVNSILAINRLNYQFPIIMTTLFLLPTSLSRPDIPACHFPVGFGNLVLLLVQSCSSTSAILFFH